MKKETLMEHIKSYDNEQGETIHIFSDHVKVVVPKIGFWESMKRTISSFPEGMYTFPMDDIRVSTHYLENCYLLRIRSPSSSNPDKGIYAKNEPNLKRICKAILETQHNYRKEKALEREKNLDYHGAIELYESIEMPEEAARVRRIMYDEKKVAQTVVHGDYVDDRDTIVKDSVISKSSIGAGGKSKGEQIKVIKELLDSGAIDDDEFKQMKKDILGK